MIAESRNTLALKPTLNTAEKERELQMLLRSMRSVVVAFSGGVDSSYLALIATRELGEKAHCVTGLSPSVSAFQRSEARKIAEIYGFNWRTLETSEMDDPAYRANAVNRCYFCKTELFGKLTDYADENGLSHILDGTNADDLGDHRPGRIAAEEKFVRSPLAELGFTKQEIRERSRLLGLSSWEKPSSPCLSSRIAHGVPVTIKRLGMIERAEDILRNIGCREFRVRVHGNLARIELIPDDFPKFHNVDKAKKISAEFHDLGFKYVTLDLEGFRSGAMNE